MNYLIVDGLHRAFAMYELGVADAAIALLDRKSVVVDHLRVPLTSLLTSTDEIDVSDAAKKWRLE